MKYFKYFDKFFRHGHLDSKDSISEIRNVLTIKSLPHCAYLVIV